jgi:AcrR family transcriptional regulator
MRENVRERILTGALKLLNEQGFSALTQARVAADAGVRQSHLTYYFPTRNDLLKAIVQKGKNTILAAMTVGAQQPLSPDIFKKILIKQLINSPIPRLMVALTAASDEDDTLRHWMTDFDSANRQELTNRLNQMNIFANTDDVVLFHTTLVGAAMLSLHQPLDIKEQFLTKLIHQAFQRLVESCQLKGF